MKQMPIFMELLAQREFKAVRSILNVMNAVDIASLLSELDDRDLALAFRLIPKDKAAEVFANMGNSLQSKLIDVFTEKELKEILDDMYMDDTVDMLEDLPANVVTRILETVGSEKRAQINILLRYPEDSAGSIMTTEYVDLRRQMTVREAMEHIRRVGIHKETIYTCYVLESRRLLGIVTAKDLMTSEDNVQIQDLMETEIISIGTHADQEEVARLFAKYDLLALPVLDADQCMVGIVTVDDAMDVVVDEATEDMTLMAAVNPSEKTYFETSVFEHAKNRIPWLLVLMLTAAITGTIITRYENAFADGYRRKLRFPEFYPDHSRNCPWRNPVSRPFPCCFQRIPDFSVGGNYSCSRQRASDSDHVQGSFFGFCDCGIPDHDGHAVKNDRLHAASSGQKSPSGSCYYGCTADHYNCGYLFHLNLF